jgi:predicted site-specific integrase-resolvase
MASSIACIPATKNLFTAISTSSISRRRVAIYARVSTDSDEQFTGFEAQIDYYTKFVQQRED